MATVNGLRKFAEQAIRVERVLNEEHVAGSAGRVVYLLSAADRAVGVSQKDMVTEMALPKDVVSKLVGFLVDAELASNPRMKRLANTDSGRDLLSRLKAALQPPRSHPAAAEVGIQPSGFNFDFDEDG
jgi:hypothetical protein